MGSFLINNMLAKKDIIPIVIIIIALIVGAWLYPSLPERIPVHWNSQGEADGWGSKDFGVFFLPILALGVYLLMTFIPRIDPLKKNYEKFKKPYFYFKLLLSLFFVFLYFFTLCSVSGFEINIAYFMLPAFSFLFILMGAMLPKLKRNYFIGIRTPWTIHSDIVWEKTHKFSSKIFIAAGTISLVGMIFPSFAFSIFITAVIAAAIVCVAYSYFLFRRNNG